MDDVSLAASDRPIVIPTASSDLIGCHDHRSPLGLRSIQSAGVLQQASGKPSRPRYSLPSFSSSLMGNDDLLTDDLRELHMAGPSELDMGSGSRSGSPNKGVYMYIDLNDPSASELMAPSAVNLKTGASVFSLDVSPKMQRKLLPSKSPKPKRKPVRTSGKSERKRTKARSNIGVPGKLGEEWMTAAAAAAGVSMPTLSVMQMPALARERHIGMDDSDGDHDGDDSPDIDEEYSNKFESAEIYAEIAAKTKSVGRFNKLAYPDMYGHLAPPYKEQLYEKKFGTQRSVEGESKARGGQ